MKTLIAVLVCMLTMNNCYAETFFQCKTPAGLVILETMSKFTVFTIDAKSCVLTNNNYKPTVNQGQGFESWELDVGNDAATCSYAIEYYDKGEGKHYSIVELDKTTGSRYDCYKDSVIDNLSNQK